jgi:AhpD family alkylhydroperoxidase
MEFSTTQKRLAEVAKRIRQAYGYYRSFSNEAFTGNALTLSEKEIIAVAVAHSTKCIYCIRFHTKKAKQAGVSVEELLEAATITGAVEASNTVRLYRDQLQKEHAFTSYNAKNLEYLDPAQQSADLSKRLRLLIIIAVTHAIATTSLQQQALEQALAENISEAEIEAAILVTAALKAGGAVSHSAELIDAYNEE